ncbi:MAG TPA: DnaA/Hda family protein, partial [Dehalococcoidia bacterium]|nr:DnaA/Hda family protein [Dehalococcoidia bacterium]
MTLTTPLRPAQEIWETALGQLEIQVTRSVYDTWLKSTSGLTFHDGCFVVSVPTPFVAESLETRFQSLVKKTLVGVVGQDVSVEFRVTSPQMEVPPASRQAGVPVTRSNGSARSGSSLVWLNNKYTFDTFIMGSSNRLAYAAAQAVADNPGSSYNPLFIYGAAGL